LKLRKNIGGLALSSYDDIFSTNAESGDTVTVIPLEDLHEYKGHPFYVKDDADMDALAESIRQSGVLVPGVARPRSNGGYEIIAGHRRRRACEIAGLEEMPMIVRNLSDDEAAILMVDSNLQREEILPSEKAYAYKIKLEAVKRQMVRTSGEHAKKKSSILLAEDVGESKNQIYRYIRLTELVKNLLDMVDEKRLSFVAAVELSYLAAEQQETISELLDKGLPAPSLSQAQKLREAGEKGELDERTAEEILMGNKAAPKPLSIGAGKLKKYFPKDYTAEKMEAVVFSLLEKWSSENSVE
jgi:ParB family chromosome partitioning protein